MKQAQKQKSKALVCLSGGVDSSVAAALLLQQGYEVTSAYMKQWSDAKDLHGVCSWKDDRREALRVAAKLRIPFLTLDFEKEYREWVVKYMFREYQAGRTPNPDVMCNKFVKFGVWLKKARALGFDFMATGHYARILKTVVLSPHKGESKRGLTFHLREAKDKKKDQTYFLHQLIQEQLAHVLFPIGDYTKQKVRALAKKFQLPTAERPESMGICFIGEISMKEFLQKKIKPKKGKIVNSAGEVIGDHEGLPFYTIGQRHGFSQTGGGKPYYIVGKEQKKNQVIVGFFNDPLMYKKTIEVGEMNWIDRQRPAFPLQCQVRLRHRQELQAARIMNFPAAGTSRIMIEFQKPQKAVTPGQFAVFYKDGECLGGGVIVK